jgi:putative Ig domain-containing protein
MTLLHALMKGITLGPYRDFYCLARNLVFINPMKHSAVKMSGRTSWLATFVLVVLAGCGGGGDSDKTSAPATPGTGANAAPTIQGAPSTSVVAGQAYSFQPSASDPDGDTLTFSVSNLPAWASFNQSTGRISGTPDAADVATYSNIRVTVSDGEASASTASFAITVTDVGTASVTLSWTPPTQNEDGSALTDLAGFEVHYGHSQSNLDQSRQVTNPSVNSFVVDNLSAGTWFFAVRAVNRQGTTSQMSAVASKTVS